MQLKIKVCGMREQLNIEALCQLPIDFIGLIFYGKSSRFIEQESADIDYLKKAFKVKRKFANHIHKVGVFVNEDVEKVIEFAKDYNLDYVQLHGNENVFYCKKIKAAGIKIIKAFPVDEHFSFTNLKAFEFYCDYFLFDTKGKLPGGNGVVFNWNVLEKYQGGIPFFLSGGLAPGMEQKVINFKHEKLVALDLNSGFEIRPAHKNIELTSDFINEINKQLRSPHSDW